MGIIDTIFYWAKTDPHRHALIQPQIVTTYEAMADAIESTVDRIEQLGLDRREAVGTGWGFEPVLQLRPGSVRCVSPRLGGLGIDRIAAGRRGKGNLGRPSMRPTARRPCQSRVNQTLKIWCARPELNRRPPA